MFFKKYTQSFILFMMIELSLLSFYLIDKYIEPTRLTIAVIAVPIIYGVWLLVDIRQKRE